MLNVIDLYGEDGVHMEAGDLFSAHAGRICSKSFHNSRFVRVSDLAEGYFRGIRSFRFTPGIWLFHCHVNDHLLAGMLTRYQVLPSNNSQPK